MKNIYVCSLLLLTIVMAACTSTNNAGSRALTPEQERLMRINMIDSTLLNGAINLDSLAGDKLGSISADAWMLIDDSTGCIISERNANELRNMASITKMMTCLLAIENGQMGDTIEISSDVYVAKDSRVKLGDKYTMRNLIDEMMLISDNDAAYALAKHLGGDTLKFCDMMNEKAAYLGMTNTHFANPNGLPNANNYSTASDLVRLSRYCMRDSLFAEIVGTVE